MSLLSVRVNRLSRKIGEYLIDDAPCVPNFKRNVIRLEKCLEELPRLGRFNYLKLFRDAR